MDNVMYSKSGEANAVISFGFVVEAINCAKKVIEHAPPIVNAANYVVENGIKKGGYDVIAAGFKGILEHAESIGAPGDIGEAAYKGLQNAFGGAGDLPHDIIRLKNNIGNKIAAPKVTPKGQKLSPADANNAADALNHAITEAAKAPSLMGRVGGAALKGGIAGIVIGITTESLLSYQKYKNGEITGEEYLIEVAKSGGQMGITGAATAGIVTAISVPLAAAGLAVAPITVPISIVLGAAIDKVVAPAFGRGDYYGVPPKSIVIVVGTSRRKEWVPITKREAVFRYDKHNLQEVAVDTAPDRTEQGMYFKEAYAELCLQENGTAFMMIQLGKRYARFYRYLIINDNGSIQFTDETLMWIS